MGTIYSYIEKYGNRSYTIERFNDIDNLVYSELAYIDFKDIVSEDRKTISLQDAANLFFKTYSYKEYAKFGIAFRDSYKLLLAIKDKPRYKNNLLYNYVYKGDRESQFSAMCIKVKGKFTYVTFEGTDHLLSGWKEDFAISYEFPVRCQKSAMDYIGKCLSILDHTVYIGGHSKGGNLAMVAGMYAKSIDYFRIKKIYCNDGPGFREKELNSEEFAKITKKLVCIIPNYSVVGVLLNKKCDSIVVKSTRKDVLAHALCTWCINDKELEKAPLSKFSTNIAKSMNEWINDYTDEERRYLTDTLFNALYAANIEDLYDIVNLKKIISVIKSVKGMNDDAKKAFIDLIEYNLGYCIKNALN